MLYAYCPYILQLLDLNEAVWKDASMPAHGYMICDEEMNTLVQGLTVLIHE